MVKVKQLVWNGPHKNYFVAPSVVGPFYVTGGRWKLHVTGHYSAEMRDNETAKASAQAHFESLIRSALEPDQ